MNNKQKSSLFRLLIYMVCLALPLRATARRTQPRAPAPARQLTLLNEADIRLYLGGRYHSASEVIPLLPYTDGDFSMSAGFEFDEASGYWQLLVNYAESPGDKDAERKINAVITPQLNLVLRDGMFLAGVGVLRSYLRTADAGAGWTKFYFQMKIGAELGLTDRMRLSGFAVYPFARWNELNKFRTNDIEYSAGLSYNF